MAGALLYKAEVSWRKTPQEQLDTWEPEAFTSPQPMETHLNVLRQCATNRQRTHVVVLEAHGGVYPPQSCRILSTDKSVHAWLSARGCRELALTSANLA